MKLFKLLPLIALLYTGIATSAPMVECPTSVKDEYLNHGFRFVFAETLTSGTTNPAVLASSHSTDAVNSAPINGVRSDYTGSPEMPGGIFTLDKGIIQFDGGTTNYFDVRFTNPDLTYKDTMALVVGDHESALPWNPDTTVAGTQNQYFYQLYIDVPAGHADNLQYTLARTPPVGGTDPDNVTTEALQTSGRYTSQVTFTEAGGTVDPADVTQIVINGTAYDISMSASSDMVTFRDALASALKVTLDAAPVGGGKNWSKSTPSSSEIKMKQIGGDSGLNNDSVSFNFTSVNPAFTLLVTKSNFIDTVGKVVRSGGDNYIYIKIIPNTPSTKINSIEVDGVTITSGSTSSTSSANTLASYADTKVSANGWSATASGNVLTLIAPVSTSSAPASILINKDNENIAHTSTAFAYSPSRWAPNAGNSGVDVAGDLVLSGRGVTSSTSKTGFVMRVKYEIGEMWDGIDWLVLEAKTLCLIDGVQAKRWINIPVTVVGNEAGEHSPTVPVSNASCVESDPHTACAKNKSNNTNTSTNTIGNMSEYGAIIINNVTNPGQKGIMSNMRVTVGGSNLNVTNSIAFDGIHIMQRQPDNSIWDEIGSLNTASVSQNNFGTTGASSYFPNGESVLDLGRYRAAADWIRLHAPSGIQSNRQAGTITWKAFSDNVAISEPMYGFTRVVVPLVKQTHYPDNVYENNALGKTAKSNTIYRFCDNEFTQYADCLSKHVPLNGVEIEPGDAMYDGQSTTPSSSDKITVYGQLFFDFVNIDSYDETALDSFATTTPSDNLVYVTAKELPFRPRSTLVETPLAFEINPARAMANNSAGAKVILDSTTTSPLNLDYIFDVTKRIYCDSVVSHDPAYDPMIAWAFDHNISDFEYCTYKFYDAAGLEESGHPFPKYDAAGTSANNMWYGVASSVTKRFTYQTGLGGTATNLDLTQFNALNRASQYHALFPTGYEQGWLRSMNVLQISPADWKNPSSIGFNGPATLDDANYKAWNNLNFDSASANAASCGTVTNGSKNVWCSTHEERNDESLIRSNNFEDIPAYISTGGLFQLRGHVNISGLMFIPQALEFNHDEDNARQYLMGGAVVRDGFAIHLHAEAAHTPTIPDPVMGYTIITSDPESYNTIAFPPTVASKVTFTKAGSAGGSSSTNPATAAGANNAGSANCLGCAGSTTSSTSIQAKKPSYVIVKP